MATAAAPGSFEVLYLAENAVVALFEAQALLGSLSSSGYLSQPRQAWIVINVDTQLQEVTDLTHVQEQQTLETSAQELTGDWRGYQLRSTTTSVSQPTGAAPTQQLGEALFQVPGLEGFQTLSSRLPDHRCLVIFPEKLRAGSRVQFHHPAPGITYSIP